MDKRASDKLMRSTQEYVDKLNARLACGQEGIYYLKCPGIRTKWPYGRCNYEFDAGWFAEHKFLPCPVCKSNIFADGPVELQVSFH